MAAVSGEVAAEVHNCRILVVDDNAVNRKVLLGILSGGGFSNLLEAADGEEALELARSQAVDLMLLDLMMPGLSGFEVCEQARGESKLADLPIVVQTAVADVSTRTKVFDSGASDLIAKPLNVTEVLGRVRVHLANRLLLRDLRGFRERLGAELEIAQAVQHDLLPKVEDLEALQDSHGLDVAGHFQPSSELGGDLWGLKVIDDRRVALYLADFSGHGVGAALNTVRLSTLITEYLGTGDCEPSAFLNHVGRALHGQLAAGQFCTMLFGMLDVEQGRFDFAAAASPSPLCFQRKSGRVIELDGSGLLLGVLPDPEFERRSVPFGPGDAIIFYSDALVEVRDVQGETLDPALISRVAGTSATKPGRTAILDDLLRAFRSGRDGALEDDLTIVTLRRSGPA